MDKFVSDFESRHPDAKSVEFNRFFDNNTDDYQSARPGYPSELFSNLLSFVSNPDESRVLEIGVGNGVATAELAKGVRSVLAIEPGAELLSQARQNCSHLTNVEFQLSSFEEIQEGERFDLVAAFTAFHWIRAQNKFERVASMLTDSGVFAACWNSYMPPKGEVGAWLSSIIASAIYPNRPARNSIDIVRKSLDKLSFREKEIQDQTALAICGLRRYVSNYQYDAGRYCALLNTFPNISSLEKNAKEALFAKVCDKLKSQTVTIPVISSLTVARQRASLERDLREN